MVSVDKMIQRAGRFVFCAPSRSEVHLERREQPDGSVLWAILQSGNAWTRRRRWEFEPIPSSRTAAYLKRARWTFEEAWAECERIERDLGFGLAPTDVLARCAEALGKDRRWTFESRETDAVFRFERDNFRLRFPSNPGAWPERELREVAVMAAEGCRLTKVKVDFTAADATRSAA